MSESDTGTAAFWPVATTLDSPGAGRTTFARDLQPTLVISTTGDPATPYQAGVELAQALHGGLLTVEGTQHTAAAHGNACVDDIVSDYLVHLTPPTPHARCVLRAVEADTEHP